MGTRLAAGVVVLATVWGLPSTALALQPLETFVEAAQASAPDIQAVEAFQAGEQASANVALGRLLPTFSIQGTYTRNQYEYAFGPIPELGIDEAEYLLKHNQMDAVAALSSPVMDLAGVYRLVASRRKADASELQARAVRLVVIASVVQTWYQVAVLQASIGAGERALEVARRNLQICETRRAAGRVTDLEVLRAQSEVQRRTQVLLAIQSQMEIAADGLASLSGIEPDLSTPATFPPEPEEEPNPSASGVHPEHPAISAAESRIEAAQASETSQRLGFAPSLWASVMEHGTNTEGFIGEPWTWGATVSVRWTLDATSGPAVRAREAEVALARAEAERTRRNVEVAMDRARVNLADALARRESARAEQEAMRRAAEMVQTRFEAGTATQTEILSIGRDAFLAEDACIRAEADVAAGRVLLTLAEGEDPFTMGGNR